MTEGPRFRPSAAAAEPVTLVSVSVIAAEDDDRARWLAGPVRLKVLSRARGRRILLPSPEEAAANPRSTSARLRAVEALPVLPFDPPAR